MDLNGSRQCFCGLIPYIVLLCGWFSVLNCSFQWRNKPYSQTGCSKLLPFADQIPAELRLHQGARKNYTRPKPTTRRSRGGLHSKNASILIRVAPTQEEYLGKMLHANEVDIQGRKSSYGSPRYISEDEVNAQQVYNYEDLYQKQSSGRDIDIQEQCIVLDLAATLPPGLSSAVSMAGRYSRSKAVRARRTIVSNKAFPGWWQYLQPPVPPSQDYGRNRRTKALHCNGLPTADSLAQICYSQSKYRYRTYDGSCNNLHYIHWGSADSRYSRLTKATYDDGVSRPRQFSVISGYGDRALALPNPRVLSRSMSQSIPVPHRAANILLPYFGQIVAHDLAFTASHQIDQQDPDCCVLNADCTEPECFQFSIPHNDPLYAFFNLTCHQFARSVPSSDADCPGTEPGSAVREQTSKVTHWLDASFLYGNSEEQNEAVRNLYAGQLAFRHVDKGIHNLQGTEIHKQILPSAADAKNFASSCPFASRRTSGHACFYAADERVNQQPLATAVHTIFLRFHNLVAGSIAQASPYWSDEMIFQEARKIVTAIYQIVIYKEFLPGLLGSRVTESSLYSSAGLRLMDMAHYMGYDGSLDPHVLNEFAAAGFRLHTLVDDNVPRLLLVTGLAENVLLSTQFNNQTLLYEEGNADALISGMLEEMALAFDPQITEELQGRLFRGQDPIGLDLMAISIQRGRDHGLGTYNDVRDACGYGRAEGFEELRDFMPAPYIHLLRTLYRDVDDIDLMVGGLMEDALSEDASVGPTFACIISAEFQTKRSADRFWHENPDQFSSVQLPYLRRITMSHLLCHTTGLRYVPSNAFFIVSETNPLVPCIMINDFDMDFYLTLPGLQKDS